MQETKSKKAKAKGTWGKEDKSTVRWSPLKGVQMLELNRMHMFHIRRAQFAAAMKSKFGDISDFIYGGPVFQPQLVVEDYAAIGLKP